MFFGLVVPNNSPKKLRILVRLPDGVFFRPKLLILHFVNVITKLCSTASALCLIYIVTDRCGKAVYEAPPPGGLVPPKFIRAEL